VDGPPHDFPERQARDKQTTRKLDDLGWIVIRFHHQADWERLFAGYPGVFGEIAR
jgi:very-short-patch-repair endonuclease